ncbi:3,4-dihydroxy-2-butanone-4-phosphate synthase [uncultured Jatrophihabitans sp.]|uniref:3,4-dihydroxy-2-butanone-4-phosphate synthase n=1 Tax=uncultured Jatrophihabitans sp. TaxID=1610747 RepID=UPI0035CA22D2
MDDFYERFGAGSLAVLLDDAGASRRGAPLLVVAAALVEPTAMAALVRHSSGFVQVALPARRCAELVLPPLADDVSAHARPTPAVAVDAADGVTTGISAHDRAHTARLLADPDTTPADLNRPGHVVPLRMPDPGAQLFGDAASAQAAVRCCGLAGLPPAVVLAHVVLDSGGLASAADAISLARQLSLPVTTTSAVGRWARRFGAESLPPAAGLAS